MPSQQVNNRTAVGTLTYFFGIPLTVCTLLVEPFLDDYKPVSDKAIGPGNAWSIIYLGTIGCVKYLTSQRQPGSRSSPVQTHVPITEPVQNASVEMDIPEIHFRDTRRTDSNGRAMFDVKSDGLTQARATIRLADISGSPRESYLAPYVGKTWTYDLRFNSPLNLPHSASPGRVALPSPTWTRETVAIADIALAGLAQTEGDSLRDWFVNGVAESSYFRLVSRSDMIRILDEQKFQSENCSDTGCLVEMGRLLAARHIIGGRIARMQDQSVFTARLVDVESGEVIATASDTGGTSTQDMLGLMSAVAESLCRDYGRTRQQEERKE